MPQAFVRISQDLLEASRRAPLLTPNERLARELLIALNQAEALDGRRAWVPATVMSWQRYMAKLSPLPLLGASGLRLLARDTATAALVGFESQAVQAWRLRHQYALEHQHPSVSTWFDAIDRRLERAGLLADGRIEQALEGTQPPHPELALVAFEHMTPAQQALLSSWRDAGLATMDHLIPEGSTTPQPRRFATPQDEVSAAAWWVRDVLTNAPDTTVGILLPDLPARYEAVVRQFGAVLDPKRGSRSASFDIGAAPPLGRSTQWQDAVLFLRGLSGTLAPRDVERVLASRHFNLRVQPPKLPWLTNWETLVSQLPNRKLIQVVQDYARRAGRDGQNRAALRDWVVQILAWLQTVGWGQHASETVAFQTHQALQDGLTALANEPSATLRTTFADAVQLIDADLLDHPFSPERRRAPVQILGYLEHTGLHFSHLWVAGLDEHTLPAPLNPNPLLSASELREKAVPRSDHEGELQFARTRLRQWQAASEQLIISFAHLGEQNGPSSLIQSAAEDPLRDNSTHAYAPRPIDLVQRGWEVRRVIDGQLPGGSGMLQRQAECPFKAFARYRLGLADTPQSASFADAATVGTVVHKTLEALIAPGADRRAITPDKVSDATTLALASADIELPDAFEGQLVQFIARRIQLWLEHEETLQQAETVSVEAAHNVRLGAFEVKAVADRIDRIDGKLVVIDYKTGNVTGSLNVTDAESALESTQLPLYAMIDAEIAGVLYGMVHEPPRYAGVVDADLPAIGRARRIDTWEDQRATWLSQLTDLAQQFASGPAEPRPSRKACRQCSYAGLCRYAHGSQDV